MSIWADSGREEPVTRNMAVLTGTDFFTFEVLTWRGLATYYVLFFVQLETRRITLAGSTRHPTADWMVQMSRNATDEETGHLRDQRYLLHDRDTKCCTAFRNVLRSAGVRLVVLPPQSPNLNAFAERWVRSAKQECLSKLILFSEGSRWRALTEYIAHFHSEVLRSRRMINLTIRARLTGERPWMDSSGIS